jgi:formylglycine-generating enzyme required for sulfatase activity
MPPRTFGPLSTTRYTANGVAFDTTRVPPGRLVDGERREKRALLVSRPFELGVTLVTQALWRAVTGESPSLFRGDDLPVEQVSWDEVQAFLGQLDALGLRGFRLPTEAEWAWAARCGVPTRWAGADRTRPVASVGQNGVVPVGGLRPSAVGALDLSGIAWEWQQDVWSESPAAGMDPQEIVPGSHRTVRGGGWADGPRGMRLAFRYGYAQDRPRHDLGLRLARTTP